MASSKAKPGKPAEPYIIGSFMSREWPPDEPRLYALSPPGEAPYILQKLEKT